MTKGTRDNQSFVALDLRRSIGAFYRMSQTSHVSLSFWDIYYEAYRVSRGQLQTQLRIMGCV